MEQKTVKYEYQVKNFTCKKCGRVYTVESDFKMSDSGKCSQCQRGKDK